MGRKRKKEKANITRTKRRMFYGRIVRFFWESTNIQVPSIGASQGSKNSGYGFQNRNSLKLRSDESASSSSSMAFLNAADTLRASTKGFRATSPLPMVLQALPSPRGPAAPWSPLPAVKSSLLPAHPVDAGSRPGVVALAARTFAVGNALRGRWTVHLSTPSLVVKLPRVYNIDRFYPRFIPSKTPRERAKTIK